MELQEGCLLRIYVSEVDVYGEERLDQALLRAAHDAGLGGATVLRGIGGYGRNALAAKYFDFSAEAIPLVIEIIDADEKKILGFLPTIEKMIEGGAVALERVRFAAIVPPAP